MRKEIKLSRETQEALWRIMEIVNKLGAKDTKLSPEERTKLQAELDKLLAEPAKYEFTI